MLTSIDFQDPFDMSHKRREPLLTSRDFDIPLNIVSHGALPLDRLPFDPLPSGTLPLGAIPPGTLAFGTPHKRRKLKERAYLSVPSMPSFSTVRFTNGMRPASASMTRDKWLDCKLEVINVRNKHQIELHSINESDKQH